jgi:hypothetical protein
MLGGMLLREAGGISVISRTGNNKSVWRWKLQHGVMENKPQQHQEQEQEQEQQQKPRPFETKTLLARCEFRGCVQEPCWLLHDMANQHIRRSG